MSLTDADRQWIQEHIEAGSNRLAERIERAETTILRAIRELGRSHKSRLDAAEQRLSDLEQRVLDLETGQQ